MRIELAAAGKRFNREWIFRKANLEFNSGKAYAITGPNGSGKSTLVQCIGGMLQLNEGTLRFQDLHGELSSENIYRSVSFCAPYLELIEEMTLQEFLQFHQSFKPFLSGMTIQGIIAELGLAAAMQKQLRFFSSGMKQRVKLAQAIFSDVPVILLDEPCSNLDSKGITLYHSLITRFTKNRLVIVCSNDETEYSFCDESLSILSLKA